MNLLEQLDIEEAAEALGRSFVERLRSLVDGAAEDVDRFGVEIARDAVACAQIADEGERDQKLNMLKNQARALAERHRIAATNAQWDLLAEVTDVFTSGVVGALRLAASVVA